MRGRKDSFGQWVTLGTRVYRCLATGAIRSIVFDGSGKWKLKIFLLRKFFLTKVISLETIVPEYVN